MLANKNLLKVVRLVCDSILAAMDSLVASTCTCELYSELDDVFEYLQ